MTAMKLVVCCVKLILGMINVAAAVSDRDMMRTTTHSPPDEPRRILQGFGVVDPPTTISKPVLPPIFAPVAAPVAKPVSRPLFVPVPKPIAVPVPKPIAVPVPKPITVPVPASPTSGFGSGGGSPVAMANPPTAMPIKESLSTASPTPMVTTSIDDGDGGPTEAPTSASGVVIIDDAPSTSVATTKAPTKSPMSALQSSPPATKSWLSFVVTYASELYTTVKDTQNVQEILRTVHSEIRKSLHQLIKQQNVSIFIELLESELVGTCSSSANTTNPDDLVFPNFPVCNNVKAQIITKIDDTQISESTVRDSFINYVSDTFIPAYNKNSTIARLRYTEPIDVKATLNVTMVGVSTVMSQVESIVFVDSVRTVLLGLLLNGTESRSITAMNMESVKLLHQRTSDARKQRLLQASSETDVSGQPSNMVEILITSSCARHPTCTDASFATFLHDFAPQYGAPIMALLVLNSEYYYFKDIRSVIVGEQVIPALPPSKVLDPLNEEESPESETMPVWIISLIVVMSVIISTTILYICFIRLKVRKLQDDKLQDGIHKQTEEEKSNMLRTTPFTPSLAPSLEEIQDWNNDNTTQQSYQQQPQPQHQLRDLSIFTKRGQNKVQKPIQEYEEEDEYYHDNKYDNDQFSVEAGNFDDNAYDEHQWNSSFRSYT